MKNGWVCSSVICPFYKCEAGQKISCTGGNLHLHITFQTREDKKRHKTVYCDKRCDRCALYKAIETQEKDPG